MKNNTIQNWVFKIAIAVLIIFAITIDPANASNKQDKPFITSLDVNLASYHFKSKGLNQVNLGLGATKELDHHWLITGGFYENSYDTTSTYLFVGLKHDMNKWRFGLDAGFVTGYNDIKTTTTTITCGKKKKRHHSYYGKKQCKSVTKSNNIDNLDKFQFVVLPNITWRPTKTHGIKFLVIPPYGAKTETVVTAQYQYTF